MIVPRLEPASPRYHPSIPIDYKLLSNYIHRYRQFEKTSKITLDDLFMTMKPLYFYESQKYMLASIYQNNYLFSTSS